MKHRLHYILVFALTIGVHLELNAFEYKPPHSDHVPYTDSQKMTELENLMRVTHKLFYEAGIQYFAEGGTLLGAVRHKGFIP